MPTLLLFAPCEKVAFAQDNSTCLIGVLQGFNVLSSEEPAPPESEVKEEVKVKVPIHWTVFTFWRLKEDERGTLFVQDCQLVTPSGKVSFDRELEFGHDPKEYQRSTMQITGFPVGEPGEYVLRLFLRKRDQDKQERKEFATYPITVSHNVDDAKIES